MSRFYFDDDVVNPDDSRAGSDDETTLPFPAPLSRASFATTTEGGDFSAADFLASLSERHQTLEDLRDELQSLSSTLNNELLDLVNGNYSDFLGLGKQLKGSDERVEEVRVGMLGFQREIEKLKTTIDGRRTEMAAAIEQKKAIAQEVALGRRLLEIDERIGDMEDTLLLREKKKKEQTNGNVPEDPDDGGWESELDDTESDEDDSSTTSSSSSNNNIPGQSDETVNGHEATAVTAPEVRRLRRHVEQYQIITKLMAAYNGNGTGHPFVEAQAGRVDKIRSTLLLDLENLRKSDDRKASQELGRLEGLLSAALVTGIPIR